MESGQLLPQPAALLSLLSADENHGGNNHAAVSLQTRDPEAYRLQVYLAGEVAAREPDQTLVATGNPERSLVGAVCRKRTPTVGRSAVVLRPQPPAVAQDRWRTSKKTAELLDKS